MAETSRDVDTSRGQILILESKERYPRGSSILMNTGFPLILLNMVFGLFPTTLVGPRLTYARCSLAQAYAFAFGLCVIILSGIFLPVVLGMDLGQGTKVTGAVVVLLTKITHVGGFLLLLARGHFVARKLTHVWALLSKLMQIAIVDLHGRKYRE
jgi:hypothetical protein